MSSNPDLPTPVIASDMLMALFLSQHLAASSGTGSSDFEQLEQILDAIPQVKYVCLDVANGYSEHFVEFVKDVRKRFPEHTIMVCLLPSGGSMPLLLHSSCHSILLSVPFSSAAFPSPLNHGTGWLSTLPRFRCLFTGQCCCL